MINIINRKRFDGNHYLFNSKESVINSLNKHGEQPTDSYFYFQIIYINYYLINRVLYRRQNSINYYNLLRVGRKELFPKQ